MNLKRLLVLAFPAAFAASLSAQTPRVRDSSGVRIVENPSRLKAPVVFKLGPTPTMDVGGLEDVPANEFDSKQGYLRGVVLSDGGLAVIDVNRVHFFDARGKRLKIAGRKGSGPGEFQYVTSICRTRGDTLVLGDGNARRTTILDGQGAFIRNIVEPDLGYSPFDGCLDDGTFILEKPASPPPGGARPYRITRLRTDGTTLGVLGEFDYGAYDMTTGRESIIAAAGRVVYFTNALTSEVRVFTPDGKLTTIIRSDDPPVAITDAQLEQQWARTIPNNMPPSERQQRIDQMRSMPHASTWPTHRRIHVDPAGRLWVQDFSMDRTMPVGWTAFDATGKIIGRLMIPGTPQGQRPSEVVGFGKDQLIVRRSDSEGALHLTVYPIISER